jgi:hypothetical protein
MLLVDLFGDGHVWCSAFAFWNIDFSNRKKSLEFLEYPSIKLQESEFLESGIQILVAWLNDLDVGGGILL